MKLRAKIAIAVAALGFGGLALVLAGRKRSGTPDRIPKLPVRPGMPDPELVVTNVPLDLTFGSELPEGWETMGWYTYRGNAPERLWIRVDKGPPEDVAGPADIRPWRWTILPDAAPGDPRGQVPIATEVHHFAEFNEGPLAYTIAGLLTEYGQDALMLALMPRDAAEQIDAMYGAPP